MTTCDIEQSEQCIPENLSTAKTGKTCGNWKHWLRKTACRENLHIGSLLRLSTISIIIVAIHLFPWTAIGVKKSCPALPACPDSWVGYKGKCYYFAKAESNWTSSKMHCSSLSASLAVIDSQEEMDFMRRYKGPIDHWIGLVRNPGEPWKWINGTTFNNWFTIPGGGSCAYMNQEGIASLKCSREQLWICSKLTVT